MKKKSGDSKVLGVVGSPRAGGNTDALVEQVLEGATAAGAQVEKVMLNDFDIRSCKGCWACHKQGHCVQDDDLPELVEKLVESRVWVLGTPIYWWGPSAQLKAFLDRWVSLQQSAFTGKRIILTIPMGGGSESYARHTTGMFRDICNYLGIDLQSVVLAPGVSKKGEVRHNDEIMKLAYQAGFQSI
ncbi:MAG: flavodoxin family protein [Candidatus Hodarchaeota archaeon]